MFRSALSDRRWLRMAPLLAGLAYLGALLAAGQGTAMGGVISGLAITALGAALALYTAARTPAAPQLRLGARAEGERRRYHALALGAAAVTYAVLIVGGFVAHTGSLGACPALPFCLDGSAATLLITIHRGLAALATLLIGALAAVTWRRRPERSLRRAAGLALVLVLSQDVIGLAQVLLAAEAGFEQARIAHLAAGALTWGALVVAATLALRLPSPAEAARPRSTAAAARPSLLKDYVSLTKPGVITLLIFTTIAAMYITPAGAPELPLVLWTTLGGWLMASGAHALNCYFDRDIDVLMGRTGRRPLPSGRIPPWHAAVLGIALGALAFAILVAFVNWAAALLALAGFIYYVGIYTLWLKRNTWHNIVIGGGAGAFPPLVGWAAVTGGLTPGALLLFAIVFYWTPPHFWALAIIRQKDYARAGVPMLPVVAGDAHTKWQIVLYSLMLVALSVLPTPLGMLGVPYLVAALALGGVLLYYAVALLRRDTTAAAWGLYKFSLLYLALLFAAMVVDRLAFA